MKFSIIAAICVMIFCISGTVNNAAADEMQCEGEVLLYRADLTNKESDDFFNAENLDGFTIKSVLGQSQPDAAAEGKCNLQDVLKITFPKADSGVQKRMLKFDLKFDTSIISGHAFHLGDSCTNRAIGDDDGGKSIPYIGEAFSLDRTWIVHTNDLPGHEDAAEYDGEYIVVKEDNYITDDVELFIGDEYIRSYNYQSGPGGVLQYQSKYIPAALSGQGQDYDIAVGMNRLIDGKEIDGIGLCHITISACDAPTEGDAPKGDAPKGDPISKEP